MSPLAITTTSPILIIGAGLGGLLLAQGLKRAGIPFHVFERDFTSSWRAQGYRIRIHSDGITALESTLPADAWAHFEQTCAHIEFGGLILDAFDAKQQPLPPNVGPYGPPEHGTRRPYTPDRTTMRTVFLAGLEDHITYGKEFVHYTVSADNTVVTAHFADGGAASGCLLVGADGAGSRVRRQFAPALKPVDTQGRIIFGKTPLTPELLARLPPIAAEKMTITFVHDTSRAGAPLSLLCEPMRFPQRDTVPGLPEDYMYWVLTARSETFGHPDEELVRTSGPEAAQLAIRATGKWDASIRALFELQDPEQASVLLVRSMRPELVPWTSLKEPVTLLGDAVHVMAPSAGRGAVTAFRDAAELVRVLTESGVTKESIGRYEEKMRAYVKEAIEQSRASGVRFFNHPNFEDCKELEM